mgnify:FL=1
MLGARFGYQLTWTLIVSAIALVLFQDLGARIGVVTRQGLIGLIRQKYGARAGSVSATTLLLANLGTMTAEFAGIAAAGTALLAGQQRRDPLVVVLHEFAHDVGRGVGVRQIGRAHV